MPTRSTQRRHSKTPAASAAGASARDRVGAHDDRREVMPRDPVDAIRFLREEMALTEADLATATGASERTIRRWLKGEVVPQARYATRVDDLRAVVEELGDSLTPKGVRQWLHARNRYLEGARPIELLAREEFEAAYKAANAFNEGYYV